MGSAVLTVFDGLLVTVPLVGRDVGQCLARLGPKSRLEDHRHFRVQVWQKYSSLYVQLICTFSRRKFIRSSSQFSISIDSAAIL